MSDLERGFALDSPYSVLHWFDFLCPFCYVGQSRDAVLRRHGLTVIDLPFQAHPEIPAGGVLAGPREGPMYVALEREALDAGLVLIWPARLPDSRLALDASEWVRRHARALSNAFNSALFKAHFEEGDNLSDLETIDRHATVLGIDIEALHVGLRDGSARTDAIGVEALGRRYGVRGTPAWLINRELISGLRPTAQFERLALAALRAGKPNSHKGGIHSGI